MKKKLSMTKKELLKEIKNLYEGFLRAKEVTAQRSMKCEDAALNAEDEDVAELKDIQALYWTTTENGALRAIEQLTALKDRIERRE